ncbi:MAG: hypothetical protein M3O35_22065 [Acidobacteriota bacterium]|nr:hypothetical protein [Acidobacteriota bacterium]
MRRLKLLFAPAALAVVWGQDPFTIAPTHYHLEFENPWVRVSRISYKVHDKAPLHDHPAVPVVFVYTTDSGPIRFRDDKMGAVTRPAAKAGTIRVTRPAPEHHAVEYLGKTDTEYLRIELKKAAGEGPEREIRLAPERHESRTQFENSQVRIVRLWCPELCPASEHPGDPAVVVSMGSREVRWTGAGGAFPWGGAGEYVRLEMKGGATP